jgi:hypothetical protein
MARLATHHVPRSKMRPTDFCQFTLAMTSTHTSTVPARVEPDRGDTRISRCCAPLRPPSAPRARHCPPGSTTDDRPLVTLSPRPPRTRSGEPARLERGRDRFRRPPVKGATFRDPETPSVVWSPSRAFLGHRRCAPLSAPRSSFRSRWFCHLDPGLRSRPPHEHQLTGRRFSRPDDRLTTSATPTIRGHAPGRSILAARCLPRLPDCRPRALSERTVTRFSDCEPQRRAASFRSWPPLAERGAFCGPRGHEQGDVRRRSPPRRDGGTPRRLRTAYVDELETRPGRRTGQDPRGSEGSPHLVPREGRRSAETRSAFHQPRKVASDGDGSPPRTTRPHPSTGSEDPFDR